ncbi:mechanosensitive ion channel domain-containing protein [Pseudoalteromonas sp. OOF1S-7]|uniref:mechanosensitive ion channel family protein n=1 Tax=Pseudoalteromonas sp. OOF1S-7 TaxID=2917757 RepID=UPI001EF44FF2|nr:mechanosensitive ion channel domain-containing protein [Pseudoalteromonas sp. OOF1S-7]MCG7535346.1 mechanosensitive ion channel [Pseudoalteromonas sp. OOF1S-7]
MADSSALFDWQSSAHLGFEQLQSYFFSLIPQLFVAAIILLLGWGCAWLLSKLALTLLRVLNKALASIQQKTQQPRQVQLSPQHIKVICRSVFWLTLLFFATAAASSLGLSLFTDSAAALFAYLPNLITGILIMVAGYLLAGLISSMIKASAHSIGFAHTEAATRIAHFVILFTAMVIGVEQLGINVHFVTNLVIVVTGMLCFGVALAFGLGSQEVIANTVAARQAQRHCRINDDIDIAGVRGRLTEITATMLVIESDQGRVLIPASVFLKHHSHISTTDTTGHRQ